MGSSISSALKKIITCGMRRPSLGQNGGDLSRLTSASSDTDSSNNTVTATSNSTNQKNGLVSPTYYPEVIDAGDLIKSQSRKRKERQDSTSSITQDRKLVRSNSEEYIPSNVEDHDALRRVSSHENFKKTTTPNYVDLDNVEFIDANVDDDDDVNDVHTVDGLIDEQNNENRTPNPIKDEKKIVPTADQNGKSTTAIVGENCVKEKSPKLSQKYRLSPIRDLKVRHDDVDAVIVGDHERMRHNERFSKTRATPGRKAISPRKSSSKHTSGNMKVMRDRDENCYKYDISALKYERRGFVSSKSRYNEKDKEELQEQLEPLMMIVPIDDNQSDLSDYNDNVSVGDGCDVGGHQVKNTSISKISRDDDENLPWNNAFHVDSPIVCQRFADNKYDYVTTNSHDKMIKLHNVIMPQRDRGSIGNGGVIQSKIQRDTIKKAPSYYLTSDEKIKQINKRLVLLKKRLSQYEEKFEINYGHKPSHNDKSADKVIKNLISEISKLRKEKHHIRSEPRNYVYSNNNTKSYDLVNEDELDEDVKLSKMKETLGEIEKRLQKKRDDDSRSIELEKLTPDELIKEKTAVQKGLLYLESIYGRPVNREERDAARPLYDRYRIIKRLVNRNATLSSSGISVPELPTILEHEAMAFTCTSSSNERTSFSTISIGESPTDTSDSVNSTDSTDTSSSMTENVHTMSIQELWTQFDLARDETKNLRKSIKEFEEVFEERNGRKMLKSDRKLIEETYGLYKQKKAKVRLLDALIQKHMQSNF